LVNGAKRVKWRMLVRALAFSSRKVAVALLVERVFT
jgi:hypothetical protein